MPQANRCLHIAKGEESVLLAWWGLGEDYICEFEASAEAHCLGVRVTEVVHFERCTPAFEVHMWKGEAISMVVR